VGQEVYCWGWAFDGQLGTGGQTNAFEPQRVAKQRFGAD